MVKIHGTQNIHTDPTTDKKLPKNFTDFSLRKKFSIIPN